jgi:hypothetical protein
MNRHLIILRKSVWVVLLAGVLACGEEPSPAPQPKAVPKPISPGAAARRPAARPPHPLARVKTTTALLGAAQELLISGCYTADAGFLNAKKQYA